MKNSETNAMTENNAVKNIEATILDNTTAIVKAYLETNKIAPADLPDFIKNVTSALMSGSGIHAATATTDTTTRHDVVTDQAETTKNEGDFSHISTVPVVPIEESVKEDAIVCLIDGVEKTMIKRHLRNNYGMEWDDYVRHFNLPNDYPSVAPGYSKLKREVAIRQGLGSKIDKTPRKKTAGEGRLSLVAAA